MVGGCKPGGCDFCGGMNIPPLLHTPQGSYVNPMFDSVKKFTLGADPQGLVIPGNSSRDLSLVAQAEENHMGDFLANELFTQVTPTTSRFAVQIKSQQTDRIFSNAPVLDRFVFGNSQLGGGIPCCFPIQASNFVQFTVTNLESTPITVHIGARGMRLLPYTYPQLREQFLAFWNSLRVTPFWLTFDRVFTGPDVTAVPGGGISIAAGVTATGLMTVPGGGDFLADEFLHLVEGGDARDIIVDIKEGVGRSIMDRPLPLGTHVGQGVATVAGLQDGELRPASGNHTNQYKQFFKRNTRLRISLENTSGSPVTVYAAWKGCAYYYPECPPGRGVQHLRSIEPTVGPNLVQPSRGGMGGYADDGQGGWGY